LYRRVIGSVGGAVAELSPLLALALLIVLYLLATGALLHDRAADGSRDGKETEESQSNQALAQPQCVVKRLADAGS
jgi:hypothetical protein